MKSKFLLFIIYFMMFIPIISAVDSTYISEISFIGAEYLEIFSSERINLTHSIFYDDAGIENSNSLFLVQNMNSSIYLIVGSNFLETYDYSKLNATIYETKKSGLGYYGLKDSGENLFLIINSTLNLSWIKEEEFSFFDNQSLNHDLEMQNYFIDFKTPGEISSKLSLPINSSLNDTNVSTNISINQTNSSLPVLIHAIIILRFYQ